MISVLVWISEWIRLCVCVFRLFRLWVLFSEGLSLFRLKIWLVMLNCLVVSLMVDLISEWVCEGIEKLLVKLVMVRVVMENFCCFSFV